MKVLVTGATGFIGGRIVSRLLREGHQVVAVARRVDGRPERDGLSWCRGDFARDLTAEDWIPRLAGVDAVVNAVGIIRERGSNTFERLHYLAPCALFAACAGVGVRRVVQISATGVDLGGLPYRTTKAAADAELLATDGLDAVVLRPSLVFGAGGESARLFSMLAALPVVPLVGRGDYPARPIHVDDVARAVAIAVGAEQMPTGVYPIGGADVVTLEENLLATRAWLGIRRRGPVLHIPRFLMALAAWFGDLTGRGPITGDELRMLEESAPDDIEPFAEAFGFRPRGLHQVLADAPSTQAERWAARLHVVRDPLRLLVASIWLITPIVSIHQWERSLDLLARSGFTSSGVALLVVSCELEFVSAIALLVSWRVRAVATLQLGMVLFFTLVLTATEPQMWLDPFGSLAKNLPLIGATLAMMALEGPSK